jgi:hypothetical protein
MFPLAKAAYYPLPSKLSGSDYYDFKEERQEHKERGY